MSDQVWYVAVGGQQQGPLSQEEVLAGIRSGRFGRDAHVFGQGMPNWVAITSRPEFAGAFSAAPAAAPGAVPPPPPVRGGAHEIDYELFGEDMQYVEITLDPGEACIAEAGAFLFMDPGIQMQTIFGDGSGQDTGGFLGKLVGAGKRLITGESLFMTLFGNGASTRQKVAFAAPYPGKIVALDLRQHGGRILCEKDAFLCAAKGISVGISFQKKLGTGLFGGEGFILEKLEGDGLAFVHSGGMILMRDLAAGETLRVDTGCLVAFESQVSYDIQFVGGIKTAVFGGEGLFFASLTGPGKVWIQSLPFRRLAKRVIASIPRSSSSSNEGSVLGTLGGLVMGGDS
jgi:uncharacterized protein (TIGR00266 family)